MPTRSTRTRMKEERKDHIESEGYPQGNQPKQLLTHNLLTNDVENINSTNKRGDLLLANKPQIVPFESESMPLRIKRHWTVTLHRSAHPQR